jgi:glycosyltransferase involved in cell wall biosynthesis
VADACQPALAGRPVYVAPTFVSSDLVSVIENAPTPDFLPDRPYLLYVGRLSVDKGVTVLADAYRQLGASAPPLLVLGAQDAACEVRWPANVHILQNVPHSQVMAAWRNALAGVIPSTYPEPFGQVAIEAMATGTPIVASAVGGLAEVVAKYPGGTLVPPGSPTALAEGLRNVLNDPEQRVRARAAGPTVAAPFFVSNAADIVEHHLAEVIAQHRVKS